MPNSSLLQLWREDLAAHANGWSKPGFQAIALYRFGVWRMGVRPRLLRLPFSLVYKILYVFVRNVYGIEVPCTATIGRRVVIEHQHGIILTGASVVGDDCIIRQGVTLGIKDIRRRDQAPRLGTRVEIGAGAKIIGAVVIGNDVKIGANAVVVSDIPDGVTVVGVPARIVGTPSGKAER